MNLTNDNYFSLEAMQEYLSVSQYKDFVGSTGQRGCEAMAMAKLRGEWFQELTTPLLVGSYVDAYFEGTLSNFIDKYFMRYLSGQKQRIFTGEIFGVKWKCKIDCLDSDLFITDLKIMAAIRESFWVKDAGYMSFVEYWGYDLQAAIYQKLVELSLGKQLPFFLAVATKEKYSDIEIIGFTQNDLDSSLSTIAPNIQRIMDLKAGNAEPDRCEDCDYCKHTKVLTKPVHFSELILSI